MMGRIWAVLFDSRELLFPGEAGSATAAVQDIADIVNRISQLTPELRLNEHDLPTVKDFLFD